MDKEPRGRDVHDDALHVFTQALTSHLSQYDTEHPIHLVVLSVLISFQLIFRIDLQLEWVVRGHFMEKLKLPWLLVSCCVLVFRTVAGSSDKHANRLEIRKVAAPQYHHQVQLQAHNQDRAGFPNMHVCYILTVNNVLVLS